MLFSAYCTSEHLRSLVLLLTVASLITGIPGAPATSSTGKPKSRSTSQHNSGDSSNSSTNSGKSNILRCPTPPFPSPEQALKESQSSSRKSQAPASSNGTGNATKTKRAPDDDDIDLHPWGKKQVILFYVVGPDDNLDNLKKHVPQMSFRAGDFNKPPKGAVYLYDSITAAVQIACYGDPRHGDIKASSSGTVNIIEYGWSGLWERESKDKWIKKEARTHEFLNRDNLLYKDVVKYFRGVGKVSSHTEQLVDKWYPKQELISGPLYYVTKSDVDQHDDPIVEKPRPFRVDSKFPITELYYQYAITDENALKNRLIYSTRILNIKCDSNLIPREKPLTKAEYQAGQWEHNEQYIETVKKLTEGRVDLTNFKGPLQLGLWGSEACSRQVDDTST